MKYRQYNIDRVLPAQDPLARSCLDDIGITMSDKKGQLH